MAKGYSAQALGVLDGTLPPVIADGAITNAHVRTQHVSLTGAAMVAAAVGAINDTIVLGRLPVGALFHSITLQSDAVFTGCTIQVGTAANPTKYGSQAAPAANTLYTFRPVAARIAGQYTAEEEVIITVTAAAIPTAFNLEALMNYQTSC